MAVQFILGNDPYQKRKQLIDDMYDTLQNNENTNMIYLIPDNVKYETETMILEQFMQRDQTEKYAGMMRLQVFSFSRLAWYLLQNQPIYQQTQLTDSGLAMIMRKIIVEEENNLTIYRGASHQEGFIARLVNLFSELRNGKISPTDLHEIVQLSGDTSQDFKYKMADLSLLYQRYDEALADKYIENEDVFHALINHIKNNKEILTNTLILIDHYEHFSAQEQELIVELAKYSKQLFISLTLDENFTSKSNDLNNPYYRPTKTYQQLLDVFKSYQIPVMDDIQIGRENKSSLDDEISQLANYWMQSNQQISYQEIEKYQAKNYENIELWASEDKQAEVFHIATKIKKMVASGSYRYNDFQVMTRDINSYELNFQAIFDEANIPIFIDEAETMAQHPLIEFIISLFSIKKRHYRLDDIMRLLRTELLIPNTIDDKELKQMTSEEREIFYKERAEIWRSKVDIAENVALAYGYEGSDWYADEDWIYTRFELEGELKQDETDLIIQETANEVRQTFKKYIVPFINQLDNAKTNEEIATLLYQFMDKQGVIEQLQYWRDSLIYAGELEEAREHEQAWDTFLQLLDEFVEVLGNETWEIDLFLSIMETGFEEATFSMVPPTIDQVLITNFDLPKIRRKKVVFLIGMTDTQFPKVASNQSLLTDEDRELIDYQLTNEKYLAVSELESSANEPFAMYLAILQANEKIIFTYPTCDEENNELRISPYIKRIQDAFSLTTKIKYSYAISVPEATNADYLEYIGSKSQTFGQIIISLRYAMDNNLTAPLFFTSLFRTVYDPSHEKQRRLFNSLRHKNLPKPITKELAEELYGKDLYLSVSQLETFYQDPYSHFLLYGLRLKERQVQELSPLETGNFFHDSLDLIGKEISLLDKDIANINTKEIEKITNGVADFLLKSNKYRLSRTSKRMNFIFDQLTKTVKQMVQLIVKQSLQTKFRPNRTELLFGRLGDMRGVEGLSFPLSNNGTLYLRGKIDRIDTLSVDDQLYAGIVDYKSSASSFNYQKMYYGLMLQMITYLDTVLTNAEDIFGKDAKGIGAFYSQIHNPFINIAETNKNSLEDLLLKKYKYDGLIINERAILEAADTGLEQGYSNIYPIHLKTNDDYSGNNILTEEEYNNLIKYNRKKIQEAGNRIISGETALKPFEEERYTPSVNGPYRAISQFDALLPENNYQDMKKIRKKEFFELINSELENKEEAED